MPALEQQLQQHRRVPSLVLRTFPAPVEIRTPRLLLRQWKDSDLDAWCEMNADAEVRKYFPKVNERADSEGEASRMKASITQRGWGFWAVEVPSVTPFIGAVGLFVPTFEAPWQPAVEVGWRLKRNTWGKGFATEAALAARDFGFTELKLPQIIAMSVITNEPSHRVMHRIGMARWDGMEFDHPRVPHDWPLKRHIVHRITHDQWLRQQP
jgi:RimJ/RimL family protein N-acetyltransferase